MGSIFSSALANAIANAEGFGVSGAIPTRANNPGDLALGDIGYGTLGNGITVFPDVASGAAALENQVNKMVNGGSHVYDPNMTIAQAGQIYSGGDSNWAKNVAQTLGVPSSTTLADAGKSLGQGSSSVPWSELSLEQMQDWLTGHAGTAMTGTQDSSFWGFGLTRIVTIIVGLISLGAGLMMFKPVRDVSVEFGKGVAKGAMATAV